MTDEEAYEEAVAESVKHAEEEKARRDKDASAMLESEQAALTSRSLQQSMKAVGAVETGCGGAIENPLLQYALSPQPVMLRYHNFKHTGILGIRDLWPSRVAAKVRSLRSFGWLVGECVHAIADEGVSVSDGKLDHDKDACAAPWDGCHRIEGIGVLERGKSGLYYGIPTILYQHDTPKPLWKQAAFARLEVNASCMPYSTIDLIRLVDATLSEHAGEFEENTPLSSKASVVFEAWYGAPPADSSLRVTARLDIPQITNVLECHEELVASGQLDFVVKELGARDHQRAAMCCHQLLGSEGDPGEFTEGACFLALPGRRGNRFLPFAPHNKGIFRAYQRDKQPSPELVKELFLWVYGSWVMSWGAKRTTWSEWKHVSDRIKRRGEAPSDLDILYELQSTAPTKYDLFTLELLAAQPGLLKKAAINLKWTALLEKNLTGSRNSVVRAF